MKITLNNRNIFQSDYIDNYITHKKVTLTEGSQSAIYKHDQGFKHHKTTEKLHSVKIYWPESRLEPRDTRL